MLYCYRAVCSRVIDGDTIECAEVDLGHGVKVFGTRESPLRYRLAGINTYETRLGRNTTPEEKAIGLEAKAWLAEEIEGKTILINTVRAGAKGNLGRYLAWLFRDGTNNEMTPHHSINRELLDLDFGVVSDYPDGDVFIALGYERETE